MLTINQALLKFPDAVAKGEGWMATCPAHPDKNPSLSIKEGDNRRALLHCFAGCTYDAICCAIGVSPTGIRKRNDRPSKSKKSQKSKGPIVAEYDYCDENKKLLFQVVRHEPKAFSQRRPNSNGGWIDSTKGVRKVLYRLPELLAADPSQTVYITEGEKDCDRLLSLGLVATCNSDGADNWKSVHSESLNNRCIAIMEDNDDAGRKRSQKVALQSYGIAERIRIVALPGLLEHGDVTDWLNAGGTIEQLEKIVSETPIWEPNESQLLELQNAKNSANGKQRTDDREPIKVTPDEHIVIEEAITALAKDENLFVRGGVLVQLVNDSGTESGIARSGALPHLRVIEAVNIRESLPRYVYFYKEKTSAEGDVFETHIHPPGWCAPAIVNRGKWPGIRKINAITGVPVLRADGTILNTPGYDQESMILYASREEFPQIHEEPTLEVAQHAVARILDLVSDFPFADSSHQSAWLAGLFTILSRHAFDGPSPLFLFEANTRGSGKSMLADIIGEITSGRPMPRMTCPRDDEEGRKRITALAIAGDPLILLDNIAGSLGSASLDAALTGTEWTDRRLGKSEMVRMPLKAVWFATGNNVSIQADTTRRIVYCRLDSSEERPEERTDFRYPDLMAHIRENRARYLVDALTCIRAFIVAGKPKSQGKPFGSFEEWSKLVRDCICWLGLPDPTETRPELISRNDRSAEILSGLIYAIADVDPLGQGINASQMLQYIESTDSAYQNLRSVLLEACDSGGRKITVRQIGNTLKNFRGRVCSGRAIDCRKPGGTAKWFVRTAKSNQSETKQQEQHEQQNLDLVQLAAKSCESESCSGCSSCSNSSSH